MPAPSQIDLAPEWETESRVRTGCISAISESCSMMDGWPSHSIISGSLALLASPFPPVSPPSGCTTPASADVLGSGLQSCGPRGSPFWRERRSTRPSAPRAPRVRVRVTSSTPTECLTGLWPPPPARSFRPKRKRPHLKPKSRPPFRRTFGAAVLASSGHGPDLDAKASAHPSCPVSCHCLD